MESAAYGGCLGDLPTGDLTRGSAGAGGYA